MYKTLLTLFNESGLRDRVMETYNGLKQAYLNVLSSFEEVEGENAYAMVLNVPTCLTSSDVNVEYDDDENTVTVETSYQRGGVTYSMKATETLPEDADVETMSATVVNGVFTLVVDKLPEPEPEVEEVVEPEVDPVVVTIKRKKK